MRFIVIGEGGTAFWVIDSLQNQSECSVQGVVGGTESFSKAVSEAWPDVPCIGPSHRHWEDWVLGIPCDVLLSVINVKKIPLQVIQHPGFTSINYHDAILPAGAGLFSPQQSLASGQTEFGVTWHVIDEEFDTGAIVEQELVDNAGERAIALIEDQLREAGQRSFKRLVGQCLERKLSFLMQNQAERTYFSGDFRPGGFLVHSLTPRTEVVHWLSSCSKPDEQTPWHFPMVRIAGDWHLLFELHEPRRNNSYNDISIARAWRCKSQEFLVFSAEDGIVPDALDSHEKEAWVQWMPGRMRAHYKAVRNRIEFGEDSKQVYDQPLTVIGRLNMPELIDLMLTYHRIENECVTCDVEHRMSFPSTSNMNLRQLVANETTIWFQADETRSLEENRVFLEKLLQRALRAGPIWSTPSVRPNQAVWHIVPLESGRFLTEVCLPAADADAKILEWTSVAKSWSRLGGNGWNTLPKLNSKERSKLLNFGNGGFAETPKDFVDAIWHHAKRSPNDLAIERSNGQRISYRLLSCLVRRQKEVWELEGRNIKGEIVVLMIPATDQLLVAQLTILTFGGTFCSIHNSESKENIQSVIEKTGSKWGVCIEESLKAREREGFWSVPLACDEKRVISEEPLTPRDSAEVAAILLTSGTTGTPKAVQVLRSGLSNHLLYLSRHTKGVSPLRTLVTSSPSFDGVFEDYFHTLSQGGTVVFKEESAMSRMDRFNQELSKRQISVLHLNTTLWSHWVSSESFSIDGQMKLVNVGGGRMEPKLVEKWFEACEQAGVSVVLLNGYGPTETTVTCSSHVVRKSDAFKESIPIGKPQSGVLIRILDEDFGLVGHGEQGKIFVGGRGVSLGYCNEPRRTADAFKSLKHLVANFGEESFERFYNTGDFGYWDEEGLLRFIGRKDEQIKFRGIRIEMGYIETNILKHPEVSHCFVFYEKNELAEQLIAVVAFSDHSPSSVHPMSSLQAFVEENIAKHHQPTSIIEITEVPLTHSGKPDRAEIRKHILDRDAIDLGVDPARSSDRDKAASIFAATLGKNIDSLDFNRSFQFNGADSLLTMVAQTKIEQAIGRELPIGLLNVKRPLREVLDEIEAGVEWKASRLQVVSDAGLEAPCILVGHNYFGDPNMRNLWPGLAKDFTILALMCDEGMQKWLSNNPNSGMESYAAEFVESVLDVAGSASVFGLGTSWSAWLVWHVSVQLSAAGANVKGMMIGEPELYARESDFVKNLRKQLSTSGDHYTPSNWERIEHAFCRYSPKASGTYYSFLRGVIRARMGFSPFASVAGEWTELGEVGWVQFHLEDSAGRGRIDKLLNGTLSNQKLTQAYVDLADFPILLFHRSAFKSKFMFWSNLTGKSAQFQCQPVPALQHAELMLSTEIIERWIKQYVNDCLR